MTARVVQTHESPKRLARRTLPRAEWVMLMCVGVVSAAPTVDMYMTLYKIARGVGQGSMAPADSIANAWGRRDSFVRHCRLGAHVWTARQC